jgi:branched-chain amino acid transport system permease protein
VRSAKPLIAAILAAVAAMPWYAGTYPVKLAEEILIWGVFAMSLDLLMGHAGLVSFGHSAFFGLGGYVAALALMHWSSSLASGLLLPALASAVAALVIGYLSIRVSGVYFIMLTLAFSQMLYAAAFTTSWLGASDGLPGVPRPRVPAVDLNDATTFHLYVVVVFALALLALARIVRSPFGRVLRGIDANEHRMVAVGYAVDQFKLVAFVVAGALGGVAGALEAQFNGYVSPEMLFWTTSGQALLMVIIGGAGTLVGPAFGAAGFILLQSLASSYTERWMLILGAVFVGFVRFAPGGLLGLLGGGLMARAKPSSEGGCAPLPNLPPGLAPAKPALEQPVYRALLRVDGAVRRFGALLALNGITLEVAPRERRAIIGPNGAGKTTLFNVVTGELPLSAGRIELDERVISGLPPDAVARRGIARSFQRTNLFPALSVRENLRLAAAAGRPGNYRLFARPARLGPGLAVAAEVAAAVGLEGRLGEPAGRLSYGEQRQLEIGVALATRPRLLLLDEPTAGMSPDETQQMVRLLAALPREITLLIIEHDMDVVFALADRVTVLHYGEVLVEGTPEAVRADARVYEVYLGTA